MNEQSTSATCAPINVDNTTWTIEMARQNSNYRLVALDAAMKLPATKASDVTETAEAIYQWLIGGKV